MLRFPESVSVRTYERDELRDGDNLSFGEGVEQFSTIGIHGELSYTHFCRWCGRNFHAFKTSFENRPFLPKDFSRGKKLRSNRGGFLGLDKVTTDELGFLQYDFTRASQNMCK